MQDASWRQETLFKNRVPTADDTGLRGQTKIMNYLGDGFHMVWEPILWCEGKGVMYNNF